MTKRHWALLCFTVGGFGACSGDGDRCADYGKALAACLDDAGVARNDDALDANLCTERAGEPSPAYFDCVTEALEGADCSTTEGIRAASAATAPCRDLLVEPRIESAPR